VNDLTSPFLILNAALVGALVFLAYRFLQKRSESFFRDDLWEAKQKLREETRINHDIDRIALDGPEEEIEDEPTEKIRHPKGRGRAASSAKTDPMIQRPGSTASACPFRAPRFEGEPHEVLGVKRDADISTIQAAYKHWIKRYHPDRVEHLGPGYLRQATLRAELLNRAKSAMLEKIK
jgi:hypothetical protein